jgi:hypothetical protein
MSLLHIGLLIVIAAWLVQLYYLFKGDKKLQPFFVIIYLLGMIFIILGSGWDLFQAGCLIAALLVLVKLII